MANKGKLLGALVSLVLLGACGKTPSTGGTDDGGARADGGSIIKPDGGPVTSQPVAPTLQSVAAQHAGRHGTDLRMEVKGGDANGDAASLKVRFFDSLNRPVAALDANVDGVLDPEGPVRFDEGAPKGTSFTAVASLSGLLPGASTLSKLGITLVDKAGQASAESMTDISAQPVRNRGDACDGNRVLDRCDVSDSCRGTPATCQEGQPPALMRTAYLRKAGGGTRILVQGTDIDDDVTYVTVNYQDASGNPVLVDDGNGSDKVSSNSVDVPEIASAGGKFFVAVSQGEGFDTQVQRVMLTPQDAAGRKGTPQTASIATPVSRTLGQTCDAYGFDVCTSGGICYPGTPGVTNTCATVKSVQGKECAADPVINVSTGTTSTTGVISGASLWDAPAGCANNDPKGLQEATVKIHLSAPVASLTLTTNAPGTTADTILYVLPGCGDTAAPALQCNDDAPNSVSSTVQLSNVAAGDYLVVIDSWYESGGRFELAITAK